MNARQFIEKSIGRPLKSGSLGRVTVNRLTRRKWSILLEPSFDGRSELHEVSCRGEADDLINSWVKHRQELLGVDVGSYTLEAPVEFTK